MERMLEKLRGSYDYIILDLPPVGEVSDALAVAHITDGMLLVVRQNQCDRHSLTAAVRQFEFVDTRILGVVFNCVGQSGTRYGKYRYRYYKKYYRQAGNRT
jgi:Mrp family chromosome partitioning ATPase